MTIEKWYDYSCKTYDTEEEARTKAFTDIPTLLRSIRCVASCKCLEGYRVADCHILSIEVKEGERWAKGLWLLGIKVEFDLERID